MVHGSTVALPISYALVQHRKTRLAGPDTSRREPLRKRIGDLGSRGITPKKQRSRADLPQPNEFLTSSGLNDCEHSE